MVGRQRAGMTLPDSYTGKGVVRNALKFLLVHPEELSCHL